MYSTVPLGTQPYSTVPLGTQVYSMISNIKCSCATQHSAVIRATAGALRSTRGYCQPLADTCVTADGRHTERTSSILLLFLAAASCAKPNRQPFRVNRQHPFACMRVRAHACVRLCLCVTRDANNAPCAQQRPSANAGETADGTEQRFVLVGASGVLWVFTGYSEYPGRDRGRNRAARPDSRLRDGGARNMRR